MSFGYGFALPHWQTLSGGFSPAGLFAGGTVQGAWYDPSDSTTLFSDTAGTTPSPTPGGGALSVVGLMLDKSQGLALGSELVTNGDFSNGLTGWTQLSGSFTASGGRAVASNTDSIKRLSNTASSMVAGRWYKITWNQYAGAGTGATNWTIPGVWNGVDNFANGGNYINGEGEKTVYFLAPVSGQFYIYNFEQAVEYDNFSVKELAGNHAISYNTTTARPELSARVNLLTYSEQFDNAVWTKTLTTVSSNTTATTDPLGGNTADKIIEGVFTGNSCDIGYSLFTHTTGVSYTLSVYAKSAERTRVLITWSIVGANNPGLIVDLSSGSAVSTNGSPTVVITNAGNGWWRISLTITAGTIFSNTIKIGPTANTTSFSTTLGYNGDGTSGIYIWGADLRPANIGTSVPAYQRIADQYTYDSSGFPRYLVFNGTASGMYTPASIPFATFTSDGQARRNLLNNPTQFDVTASWTPTSMTVSANAVTAPDGTLSAESLLETAVTTAHAIEIAGGIGVSSVAYTASIYAKYNGRVFQLGSSLPASNVFANFDLQNGVLGTVSGVTAAIQDAGNGWYRCSITVTAVAGTRNLYPNVVPSTTSGYLASGAGDITKGVYLWGAQLETGSTATAFQNIGTDKATVFAGVRKTTTTTTGIVAETSAIASSNNGAFLGLGTDSGGIEFFAASRGTAYIEVFGDSASYTSPFSAVTTAAFNIAAPSAQLRVNAVVTETDVGSQGTGNYGSYPLNIGGRNVSSGTPSFPFPGYIYSLIVVGAASTAAQISSTESWINVKEGGVY